jgi:hypothetical protein
METNNRICFISPVDGDVLLTGFDGDCLNGSLVISICLKAAAGREITVNGVQATEFDRGVYSAKVPIDGYFNRLEAVDQKTDRSETIQVYWFKKAAKKCCFTIDDCILALEDINNHKESYTSIFESPYLGLLKDVHDQYGTCVHINLFYQSQSGFNLSEMTDKFKSEFILNSSWLHFTFHAFQEFPDKPYRNASYDKVKKDYQLVTNEIMRFAGKEVLSNCTTLHWGEANVYGIRALRSMGINSLACYFTFDQDNHTVVSYYLSNDQVHHAADRDFWVDNQENIIFVKLDAVLDKIPADQIEKHFNELAMHPHQSGFIETVIHEQYFYSSYENYEPDYRERVLNLAKWLNGHGYEPAFLSDVISE